MDHDRSKEISREEELDRFWDIDALLPKRRAPQKPAADTEATEIVLEAPNEPKRDVTREPIPPATEPKRHFIPPHGEAELAAKPTPLCEYVPDNALIQEFIGDED